MNHLLESTIDTLIEQRDGPASPSVAAIGQEARAISAKEFMVEMETVLRSAEFAKAPRMIRLLRYLVEKTVSDETTSLSEESIGLNVFDRDPLGYHTCEDPIVRVQTGRLREKLRMHYGSGGSERTLRITLPVGTYQPIVERHVVKGVDLTKNYLLALQPVRSINPGLAAQSFADGLSEELADRLFRQFGSQIVSPNFGASLRTAGAASHILEGSVRMNDNQIRASFRLVDAAAGSIAWCAQFDRGGCLTISLEEQLAKEVCDSLRKYYCQT